MKAWGRGSRGGRKGEREREREGGGGGIHTQIE